MTPEDAAKIVDSLATKDDRWLFLAMLVFVLAGGLLVIRYLVRRNEEQSKDHNTLVREMVVVLHECKNVMSKVLERIDGIKIVLLLATLATFSGCALTFSTDGTKEGTSISGGFNPTIQDFKALKELNR
jgi:cytochrome c biogenesis factor